MLAEIKVGSFEWALIQLKRGERVRRSNWAPDYYCELAVSKILLAACNILDESYIFTIYSGRPQKYRYTITSDELTATDWELCK